MKEFHRTFIHTNTAVTNLCSRCLTIFDNEDDCNNHTSNCSAQTTIQYVEPGERVGFQKFKSLYPHPYVCFLDFESLNKKVDSNNTISQQVAMQHGFGYKYCLINIIDKQNHTMAKERSYYGNDCVNDILAYLTDDWKEISYTLNYPLNISEENRKKHNEKNK